MSFGNRYRALVRRHMGRELKRSDGCPEAAVAKAERRLGIRLPAAMREYFRAAGRLDALNAAHNRRYSLAELQIAEGHLWFMEENQNVAY